MGQEVFDPDHVEGDIERLPGLGLLPVSTRMTGEKVTRQVKFQLFENGGLATEDGTLKLSMSGYEIHMGRTEVAGKTTTPIYPFVSDSAGTVLGYTAGTVAGSYIHGIFDEIAFREAFIELLYARKGKTRGESEH